MPDPARPTATPLEDLPLFATDPDAPPRPDLPPRVQASEALAATDLHPHRRRPPARPAPPPVAEERPGGPTDLPTLPDTDPSAPHTGVDWALVRAFRQQAADQLAAALRDREGLDDDARHELGRSLIVDLLSDHADQALTAGTDTFDADGQHRLATAVFDALFGLGRLQPLVDHPHLENIEITGHDRVHLVHADGRIERGPAVADSDEELIDQLAFLAARSGGTERAFSPASPHLNLTLRGGARLAAVAWVTPKPLVVIRVHRLTDVTLDDLVARDMLDQQTASFLRAAVRAKKSIVVAGGMGAGKTTLLRALANEIPLLERVGTIETEYELFLHEMEHRHERVAALEARLGSGERGPDGRAVGEITLDDQVYQAMRLNLSRLIVGEVRGKEVIAMFQAMQTGAGSLSTTHATSGRAAVERLVTCAMSAGAHVTETFAYRQVAEHINLIVQIVMDDHVDPDGHGHRTRFVSEVVAVEPGEGGRPAFTDVFRPGVDGRATAGTLPQWLSDLHRWGFDDQRFADAGGVA